MSTQRNPGAPLLADFARSGRPNARNVKRTVVVSAGASSGEMQAECRDLALHPTSKLHSGICFS
jgi:hypothetical protein